MSYFNMKSIDEIALMLMVEQDESEGPGVIYMKRGTRIPFHVMAPIDNKSIAIGIDRIDETYPQCRLHGGRKLWGPANGSGIIDSPFYLARYMQSSLYRAGYPYEKIRDMEKQLKQRYLQVSIKNIKGYARRQTRDKYADILRQSNPHKIEYPLRQKIYKQYEDELKTLMHELGQEWEQEQFQMSQGPGLDDVDVWSGESEKDRYIQSHPKYLEFLKFLQNKLQEEFNKINLNAMRQTYQAALANMEQETKEIFNNEVERVSNELGVPVDQLPKLAKEAEDALFEFRSRAHDDYWLVTKKYDKILTMNRENIERIEYV